MKYINLIFLIILLLFLSGCNEYFQTLEQPSTSQIGDLIVVNYTIISRDSAGSSEPVGGVGFFGIYAPNGFNIVSYTFSTNNSVSSNPFVFIRNDSLSTFFAPYFPSRVNYSWIVYEINLTTNIVSNSKHNGTITLNTTVPGFFNITYALGDEVDNNVTDTVWRTINVSNSVGSGSSPSSSNNSVNTFFPSFGIFSIFLLISSLALFF